MPLTEFLLARIAEDEKMARIAETGWAPGSGGLYWSGGSRSLEVCIDGERLLAECEAKRRVVDAVWDTERTIDGEWGTSRSQEQMEADGVYPDAVKHLAAVYAHHPDYRDEWRP